MTTSPRKRVITYRPDNDTFAAMTALRERDGVPFSEQIRRATRAWLEAKGVLKSDTIRKKRRRS